MKRSPTVLLVVLALLVLGAISLSSCGPADQGSKPSPVTTETSSPPQSADASAALIEEASDVIFTCEHALPGESLAPVHVYLLNGEVLVAAKRDVGSSTARTCSVEQLLRGPTAQQKAQDLTTAIPAGTRLLSAKTDRTTAIIDLSREFSEGGGSLSMMARVAQVVYTATQFSGVKKVIVLVEGQTVEALGGEGVILTEPQTRADFKEFVPDVLIERPGWGDPVRAGQTVTFDGTADASRGIFHLEMTDGDGLLVDKAMVTPKRGTEGHVAFSAELSYPPDARQGKGAVIAVYTSAQGGKRDIVAEIPLTVQPVAP